MDETQLRDLVRRVVRADNVAVAERVQSLWSGYGAIFRCTVSNAQLPGVGNSVVVKSVRPPTEAHHPRGWASDLSHQRKLRSYRVEQNFYERFAARCDDACVVPRTFHTSELNGHWTFIMEDLDDSGFPVRLQSLREEQFRSCLRWLAEFHAEFLDADAAGLWQSGTYWHLATRPDEFEVMTDGQLKGAASAVDARLSGARFRTLVHGDAKVANFCFPRWRATDCSVAAVDFQYVGAGCGMKDVAYFMSSCLDEHQCMRCADDWLNEYFEMLQDSMQRRQVRANFAELEAEWRELYPFAWADFVRFLEGWAPDHFKLHGYSRKMTEIALKNLDHGG